MTRIVATHSHSQFTRNKYKWVLAELIPHTGIKKMRNFEWVCFYS
jgi:hypothetical protein